MKRKAIRAWFGPCLLGLSVAAGCSQVQNRHADPVAPLAPVASAGAANSATVLTASSRPTVLAQARPVSSPYASLAPPPPPPVLPAFPSQVAQGSCSQCQGIPAAPQRLPVGQPVVQASYTPTVPVVQTVYSPPVQAPLARLPIMEPAPLAREEVLPKTMSPRGEPEPQRRSYVDLTASPCFGHSPDYTHLSGQVEFSRISRSWRLRFASVDEVDRFGGTVTLVENGNLDHLKDGQYVIVQGHLSNPNDTFTSPAFRVDAFRVIVNPNSADQSATPK